MRIDNIQLEGTGSGTGTILSASLATTSSFLSGSIPVSSSNASYMDIGNMRIQWGSTSGLAGGSATLTFPVPFRNTNYSITANAINGSTGALIGVMVAQTNTTSAILNRNFTAGNPATVNAASEQVSWMAIGLKP